ncbi:hypothetical protein F2Q68_00014140 [Brassica cretica]|uniref:Uncharacterized protein n=1 Tax=Brassica cretica TaxID=69181 RepID=A0A8S9HGJ6_BRACR|nr:hypothetical protein F2Q68_00014140 [Brassica cretica]
MPRSSSSSQLAKDIMPLMEEILTLSRGQRQVMHQLDNLCSLIRESSSEERSRLTRMGSTYLALMKILTLQGLAVETIELKGGLLERFTHEMEPFLRKQDVSQQKIRLRPRLAILIKTLLKKNVYQEQGKLETETVPDKACNGTSILDSSEESKMGWM